MFADLNGSIIVSMIFTYVFTYFIVTVTCFLIGIVYLFQASSDMGSLTSVRSFKLFIVFYLVFVATNMIWIWFIYGYIQISGTINSMINLSSICVASFFWFRYVESRINPDIPMKRWFIIASMIPLAIALVLIVTSPLTGLVFHYEGNEYIHGPLYSTMFLLAIVYIIYATGHILLSLRTVQSKSQRKEYMILSLFMVFPALAGLIDIFIPNLPVMELSLLFALCLVYSTIQRSQIYEDALTKMNNRRRADDFVQEAIKRSSEKAPLYLFVADLDGFKDINDKHGHIEGDKALKTVAEAFRDYADGTRAFVARWGGDEFILIIEGNEHFDPERVIKEIKAELVRKLDGDRLPFELSITMGYCRCIDPKVDANALIDSADEMMYERKGQ